MHPGLRREEGHLAFAKSDLISPHLIPGATEVTRSREKGWATCYMETALALSSTDLDFGFSSVNKLE